MLANTTSRSDCHVDVNENDSTPCPFDKNAAVRLGAQEV